VSHFFVHWPPPSARGSRLRLIAPSFVSMFSLQTPSIKKHIQLSKNIFLFGYHIQLKQFQKPNRRETYISLQNDNLKAFCSYSLPAVGFTAPSGPARGSAPSFVSLFSLQTPSINKHIVLIKNIFLFGYHIQ
jgi:hypothetical protein